MYEVQDGFKPLYKTDDPHGVCLMLLGFFLIPFSLTILWKNEKKAVTFAQLIKRARKACTSSDPNSPLDENEFKLVHVSGRTQNKVDLSDHDFGVVAQDSYRLKRKVEMF